MYTTGQSLADALVQHHPVVPSSDGFFHVAIAQSVCEVPLQAVDKQQVGRHDFFRKLNYIFFDLIGALLSFSRSGGLCTTLRKSMPSTRGYRHIDQGMHRYTNRLFGIG